MSASIPSRPSGKIVCTANMVANNLVHQYQMMLGVSTSAIIITTVGLIVTGDFPIVDEFLSCEPEGILSNVITAITSASGQLCRLTASRSLVPLPLPSL
jgi:hypothetical protein